MGKYQDSGSAEHDEVFDFIVDNALRNKWEPHWTNHSEKTPTGMPDLCLNSASRGKFIWVEVKPNEYAPVTVSQFGTLSGFAANGMNVGVWRKADEDAIIQTLKTGVVFYKPPMFYCGGVGVDAKILGEVLRQSPIVDRWSPAAQLTVACRSALFTGDIVGDVLGELHKWGEAAPGKGNRKRPEAGQRFRAYLSKWWNMAPALWNASPLVHHEPHIPPRRQNRLTIGDVYEIANAMPPQDFRVVCYERHTDGDEVARAMDWASNQTKR